MLDDAAGNEMQQLILAAKQSCDSVGGVIECMAINLPAGIGAPFFDSLESRLAHALFSVPAVKGIEFGKGVALAQMPGSEANDQMYYDNGVVKPIPIITAALPAVLPTACRCCLRRL